MLNTQRCAVCVGMSYQCAVLCSAPYMLVQHRRMASVYASIPCRQSACSTGQLKNAFRSVLLELKANPDVDRQACNLSWSLHSSSSSSSSSGGSMSWPVAAAATVVAACGGVLSFKLPLPQATSGSRSDSLLQEVMPPQCGCVAYHCSIPLQLLLHTTAASSSHTTAASSSHTTAALHLPHCATHLQCYNPLHHGQKCAKTQD